MPTAKVAGKVEMREQAGLHCTWSTVVAYSYWDMCLSTACVATDTEFQNRVILRDCTLNLPVVARQPHPDPNYAPYAARRKGGRQQGA